MALKILGMHHRRMTSETRQGKWYKQTYQYPSKKAMKKMKYGIKANVNSRIFLVPTKTRIVYCKDKDRTKEEELTELDFLGYSFKAVYVMCKDGKMRSMIRAV